MEIKSFKKELIQKYSFLTTTEAMETNKVILVTAIGIIQGTVMQLPDESEASNTITNDLLMAKLTERFAEDYRSDNKIAEDEPLPGNDGGFCLKDVCVKPHMPKGTCFHVFRTQNSYLPYSSQLRQLCSYVA